MWASHPRPRPPVPQMSQLAHGCMPHTTSGSHQQTNSGRRISECTSQSGSFECRGELTSQRCTARGSWTFTLQV